MSLKYMNGNPEKPLVPADIILDSLRTLLAERGELNLPAAGFSMGLKFQAAESLVIRAYVPGQPLPLGAVLVFERYDRWVAHRLWLKWGNLCLTGGDATWALDWPPVRKDAVNGWVVARWHDGQRIELKSATVWWRRPWWWVGGVFRLGVFWILPLAKATDS